MDGKCVSDWFEQPAGDRLGEFVDDGGEGLVVARSLPLPIERRVECLADLVLEKLAKVGRGPVCVVLVRGSLGEASVERLDATPVLLVDVWFVAKAEHAVPTSVERPDCSSDGQDEVRFVIDGPARPGLRSLVDLFDRLEKLR